MALRDELVEELDLLKKRGDVVAGAASGAAGAKTVVAGRKQVKKAKKEKYVRQIEVDDVCWVKEECGHVVIKVSCYILLLGYITLATRYP